MTSFEHSLDQVHDKHQESSSKQHVPGQNVQDDKQTGVSTNVLAGGRVVVDDIVSIDEESKEEDQTNGGVDDSEGSV